MYSWAARNHIGYPERYLNAVQVLQVHQAMAAQAATKQKEAEAVPQAKIDAEVEKRTKDLAVLPPPSPAKNQDREDR